MTNELIEAVVQLSHNGMSVPELASRLNKLGLRDSRGRRYRGKRGTYHMVSAVYHRLEQDDRETEATRVADAFPRPDGTYAYE
jgi:hypothetical protein